MKVLARGARRFRGAIGLVALFVVVAVILDGYGVYGLRKQYQTPLVVDVTSRQRALVERYIKDVVLKLDGVQADPSESATALVTSANGLLVGGAVPSPQGSLDQTVQVPKPANAAVRTKLAHERDLVHALIARGDSLLREGKSSRTFDADLRELRVRGAELSSVTGDAAGEEAHVARTELGTLVQEQIALGLLGAMVAVGMALMLRRSVKRQSGRFESLVRNSSDLITVVDALGLVTYQSPSISRLLGHDADDITGSPITELVHPNDHEMVEAAFAAVEADDGGMAELAFRVRHANGTWLKIEGTIRNLLTDKRVSGYVLNTRDVTERERAALELASARDEAMKASRLKSEFLASMSHEIRTPMNAVIGLNELLLGTELDTEQREYAAGVGSAAEGLLSIINDILDFSKVEAGRLELEIIDLDLAILMEDVVAIVGDAARSKHLELLAHAYPGLPSLVRGDPTRLRQVLLNLVSNAVKFTSEGEVVVRAKPVSDDGRRVVVRFEVSDTGLGIAPADQVRMFEAFSQADTSTTRRFGGTGLGLAIVRQLVELMGGKLGLDSEVDRGSTFWFELPFDHEGAQSAPTVAAPGFSSLRAMVVDDNATNRLILRQQLASWGLDPEEAEDAPTALERIRAAARTEGGFDFMILDLNMPGMDGLELARAIKADPSTRDAALFLLSSSGRIPNEVAAEVGLAGSLAKPVRQSELFNCIVEGLHMTTDPNVSEPQAAASPPTGEVQELGVVLLVEDNMTNQLVATRMLAKLGYRADTATNGREALDAIAAGSYDAVLMDCQMPEMDGYEATRELRRLEQHAGGHLPVIAMTAAAMEGDREACLAAGMDDYISKPVRIEAISDALGRWVRAASAAPDASAASDGSSEEPVIEQERLEVLRDLDSGDGDLLSLLVREYVEDGTRLLAALREALAEGDPHQVERNAHTLKGASANLGAARIVRIASRLEALGRAGALGTVGRLLDEADDEFALVRAALAVEVAES
jgi:PAS domain S-box-containing protein